MEPLDEFDSSSSDDDSDNEGSANTGSGGGLFGFGRQRPEVQERVQPLSTHQGAGRTLATNAISIRVDFSHAMMMSLKMIDFQIAS